MKQLKTNTDIPFGFVAIAALVCSFVTLIPFAYALGSEPSDETYYAYDYYPEVVDPFGGNLSIKWWEFNETVHVRFSVLPLAELQDAEIAILLPGSAERMDGALVWSGHLRKGESVVLEATARLPKVGDYSIRAYAMASSDGIEIHRNYYKTVADGSNSIAPLAGESRLGAYQTPEKYVYDPSEEVQEAPGDGAFSSATALATTAYVTGKWSYMEFNGSLQPIKGALVKVFEDGIIDREVGSGKTDANGRYSIPVDVGSGLYLYVAIYCETDAAWGTDYWNRRHYTNTASKLVSGSSDFGSRYFETQYSAWRAVDYATDEYYWLNSKAGWSREKLQIKYPSGSWPAFAHSDLTGANNIDLPDVSIFWWERYVVLHEYGHAAMWSAYRTNGQSIPGGCGPSPHYINSESCEGFAITEGWAEFMQCAVDNRPDYMSDVTCGSIGNIETNNWHIGDDCATDNSGAIVEGAVASILWDIFDGSSGSDNDTINSEYSKIWSILKGDSPSGANAFWTDWFQRGYGQTSGMNRIYATHGIDKNHAPSVSLTSPADESKTSDATPTFQWSGSDNDGDPLSSTFYLDDDNAPFSSPLKKIPVGVALSYVLPDFEALADGDYYWGVEITDGMAPPATSVARRLTIDRCYGMSCPSDGWYCNGDTKENRDYFCSSGSCQYNVVGTESCNNLDGWYNYGDFGASCSRMDDPTAEYRDFRCSSGACTFSVTSTKDCDDLDGYYGGGDAGCGTYDDPPSQKRDYYVSASGTCTYTTVGCPVKDCDGDDNWYDGGDAGPGCLQTNDPPTGHRDYYVKANTNECRYCTVESVDCDSQDGWYGGGNTQTATCGLKDGDASTQYRDYYAMAGGQTCTYTTLSCSSKDCNSQDGWYGGGNTAGCGDDPSSSWRDYYTNPNSDTCTYIASCTGSGTFDCDSLDQCQQTCDGGKVVSGKDYYVTANSNICSYAGGNLIEDCDAKDGTPFGMCGIEEWGCSNGACAKTGVNKDNAKCASSCDGDVRKAGYCDGTYNCAQRDEDCKAKSYYEEPATYCNGAEVWKGEVYHAYQCEPVACKDVASLADEILIERCADKATEESDAGKDYTVGGYVLDYTACTAGKCTGEEHGDSCLSAALLREFYSDGTGYAYADYTCSGLDRCQGTCPGCSFSEYVCTDSTYDYCAQTFKDPDESQVYCSGCDQTWIENRCCGDDTAEFIRHIECGDGPVCPEIDEACCPSAQDCVLKSTCYSPSSKADADSDGKQETCLSGVWRKKVCNPGERVCSGDFARTCTSEGMWKDESCKWGCEKGVCRKALTLSTCRSKCRTGKTYIQACFDSYSSGMKSYARYCPKPAPCSYECCPSVEGTEQKSCEVSSDVCVNHACEAKVCDEGKKECVNGGNSRICQKNKWVESPCLWGCTGGTCNRAMSYSTCYSQCRSKHIYIKACFDTYAKMSSYAKYCPPTA